MQHSEDKFMPARPLKFNNTRNFNQYSTLNETDRNVGLYITSVGYKEAVRQTKHTQNDRPGHHSFYWSMERKLSEYQFLYITKGQGVFKSEVTGTLKINAGDMITLFPDIWYQFKPDQSYGCNEYRIGFNGELIKQFRSMQFLNPQSPLVSLGLQEEIVDKYLNAIHVIKEMESECQRIIPGILLQLMGIIITSQKYFLVTRDKIENQIKHARMNIHENFNINISQQDLANNLGIGYSLYRQKFKQYTGFAPTQYQIQLRIQKAKELFIISNSPAKEIAYRLGFDSYPYFSRLFKQKVGFTPNEFRQRYTQKCFDHS